LPSNYNLLTYTKYGIYCPEADIFIDPRRPVENAVITHAHSDHARRGHKKYIAHPLTVQVIRHRIGSGVNIAPLDYGKIININGVNISLHPAGHIPGSAQVKVEYRGEVWVVSGDYKIENDGLTEPYEPVRCHNFITESTFALPVYKWKKQEDIFGEINSWWKANIRQGKLSILTGYSLGKAQRLFNNVDHSLGKILGHEEITSINNLFISAGLNLPPLETITRKISRSELTGALIIAPPSIIGHKGLVKLMPYSTGFASGWMLHGKGWSRRGTDIGFALSDHADWDGLNYAVKETGAENIYVTHGYAEVFVRHLNKSGYNAFELKKLGNEDTENQPKDTQLNLF